MTAPSCLREGEADEALVGCPSPPPFILAHALARDPPLPSLDPGRRQTGLLNTGEMLSRLHGRLAVRSLSTDLMPDAAIR